MGIDDGGESMSTVKYLMPTRGMLGLRSEMLTATRGTAIIDAIFDSYRPKIKGDIQSRDKGSLLAFEDGTITSFGLENAQDRGKLFVKAGEETYKNMSEYDYIILCLGYQIVTIFLTLPLLQLLEFTNGQVILQLMSARPSS